MTKIKAKREFPFMIGADPEFLMFHGAKAVDAKAVLTEFLKNKPTILSAQAGFKIEGVGEIGWDGASSTGEIRPDASSGV